MREKNIQLTVFLKYSSKKQVEIKKKDPRITAGVKSRDKAKRKRQLIGEQCGFKGSRCETYVKDSRSLIPYIRLT